MASSMLVVLKDAATLEKTSMAQNQLQAAVMGPVQTA